MLVAGIVHALVLLAIVLVLAPFASHSPPPSGHRRGGGGQLWAEWHGFRGLERFGIAYRTTPCLSTFFVTVFFDLSLAVELGMVLAKPVIACQT